MNHSLRSASSVLARLHAVEPLLRLLNDADPDVRDSAMEALGVIGIIRANEFIIKFLIDSDGAYHEKNILDVVQKIKPPVQYLERIVFGYDVIKPFSLSYWIPFYNINDKLYDLAQKDHNEFEVKLKQETAI